MCPEGKIDLEYYWNILQDSKGEGVGEIMVFGDSRLIIQEMNGKSYLSNLRLVRLINRIKSISKSFSQINFFHILCELNALADSATNKSMTRGRNELYVN